MRMYTVIGEKKKKKIKDSLKHNNLRIARRRGACQRLKTGGVRGRKNLEECVVKKLIEESISRRIGF